MIRGTRFRRFQENRTVAYTLYIGTCFLGLLTGWLVGNFFVEITDLAFKQLILESAVNLFITLPTIALLYGLVFPNESIPTYGYKSFYSTYLLVSNKLGGAHPCLHTC